MDRRILVMFLVVVAAAACPASDRTPPPPDTSHVTADGPEDPALAEMQRCTNASLGYSIAYPVAWHVNTGEVMGSCALFDPQPLEVPRASEIPIDIAIAVGVEPVPFGTIAGDVMGRRDRSRESATVAGRPAMRIDAETTGEGLHSPGIRLYLYAVDLDGSTLTAITYGAGPLPLERKRTILDAMMETLQLGDVGQARSARQPAVAAAERS